MLWDFRSFSVLFVLVIEFKKIFILVLLDGNKAEIRLIELSVPSLNWLVSIMISFFNECSVTRLQIRDKPVKKSPVKRSSPRKKTMTPVVQKQQQPAVVSINLPETNVSILQQDWDDVGDDMDMSTNIQEILEGLSKDDSHSDPPPASADSCLSAEEKQNKDDGKSKLFPLFYKETSKSDSANP